MMERELRGARRTLLAVILGRALLHGVAAFATILGAALLLDWLVGLPLAARSGASLVAAAAAVVVTGAMTLEAYRLRRLPAVALWLEEQEPELRYALVTAVDESIPASDRQRLAATIGGAPFTRLARRRVAPALARPLLGAATAAVVVMVLGGGSAARVIDAESPAPGGRPLIRSAPGRIGRVVIEVIPPAYAGMSRTVEEDVAIVRALPGSRINVRTRHGGLKAVLDGREIHPLRSGAGDFQFRMTARGMALRLITEGEQRLVTIEPLADDAPTVRLLLPERDSVLREPTGIIALEAHAADDHGLADGGFEWILTSGEGEIYTSRSGRIGSWRSEAREHRSAGRLPLDSLRMGPGDILHVRAIARDRNDVSGPSVGISETRAFRVPRRGEYDSVAVEGAPPGDVDKSALSQRMLIELAAALERRRPRIDRQTLLRESGRISADQKRLRRAVGDVIFMRLGGEASGEHSHDDGHDHGDSAEELLEMAREASERDPQAALDFEGDETPVVAINRPLLRAYNAMWSASMELDQGSPSTALPHMREALDALQEARLAERIYLRGRPPQVVVDVNRVRLQGVARGAGSTRQGGDAAGRAVRARVDRLERALGLAASDASAAADSLLILRLDLVGENEPASDALADAVNALRRGSAADASRALGRARSAILGPPVRGDGIGAWMTGGGW
jgi:hypothetical protein